MRAREFVREDRSNHQGDRARGFDPATSDALVTAYAFPSMPANNAYRAYRFAMNMANHDSEAADGPTSQFAVISAYTAEEEEIIKATMDKTGERGFVVGNRGSRESKTTGLRSPVAARRPNRYGV